MIIRNKMRFNIFNPFRKEKPEARLVDNFLAYYTEKTKHVIPYSEKLPKWKKKFIKKEENISELTLEQLTNSKNIVVITGAGISVSSGLPTFRGDSASFKMPGLLDYKKNPKKALKQYSQFKENLKNCEPNKAH